MTDTKLITLTVSVGLLLVIGGYTLVSLPHAPEEPETVKIGVMSPTTETYDRYVFLGDAALNAINSYCEETRQRYRFDFVYTDAMSHPGIVIENIQNYHNQSIDLLIGCGWSSQLCSAITYLNIHNMTLISPTSTNPQKCTRLDDGVFKMSPIDTRYGLPVARAVESLNVDRVVVMYKGDLWGEFLLESFKQAYHGEVSEIRYAAELGEGMVTEYVQAADDLIGGSSFGLSGSAVLLISTDEAVDIVKEASNYPRLMNATWFSVEEVTISEPSEEEISEVSTIKLLSPLPSLPESDALTVLENNYSDAFGESLNYPEANIYDSCWVMALSVIRSDTTNSTEVTKALPKAASMYHGLTGNCIFDSFGDRDMTDMDFWGYFKEDNTLKWLRCGNYDALKNVTTWKFPN